ncbi:hypothetical protein [Crocosphaera sp.]|uniref:hypothetical protein n=1 Tax=Crocosphaera sp. TaxID=2729996 RepID=UPI00261CF226|nr:hypothetical protein [Crocosphaera sp.]MDJ0583169.1 hypothetical protein [Crocosphaera sp.]
MAKQFEFDPTNNLYAYCIEELIDLCKANKTLAYQYIIQGRIEQWLFEIGEKEISAIISQTKQKLIADTRINNDERVDQICEKLLAEFNRRKFFDVLNIDKAIELTLKEYEALRAEILQNASEVSQLILLGLAAIFTIASLGLAPLAGFLTEEDIEIAEPITIIETPVSPDRSVQIGKKLVINNPTITNNDQPRFTITRKTDFEEIKDGGIFPSLVVINWLIPSLCLYLIYRSLYSIRKNKMIGRYISNRIEKKLIKLSQEKATYLNFDTKEIKYKDHLTHISWENYIKKDNRYLEPLDVNLIFWLFSFIIGISLIGGFFLCYKYQLITFDVSQEILKFYQKILQFLESSVSKIVVVVLLLLLLFVLFVLHRVTRIIVILIISILMIISKISPKPSAWVLWLTPFVLSVVFFIVLLQKTIYVASLNEPQLQRDRNWHFSVRKCFKIFFARLRFWCDFITDIRPKRKVNTRLHDKRLLNKKFFSDKNKIRNFIHLLNLPLPQWFINWLKRKLPITPLDQTNINDLRTQLQTSLQRLENLFNNLKLKLDNLTQADTLPKQQNVLNNIRTEITRDTNNERRQLQSLKQQIEGLPNRLASRLTPDQMNTLKVNLRYSIDKTYLLKNKLNHFRTSLQNTNNELTNLSLLESIKLGDLLRKMNNLLNKIDNFISINKTNIVNHNQIYPIINSLLLETLTLQSIDRWNNPEIIFDSVFEDVLDEMWKEDD